jgi:hypothetical protein
MLTSAYSLATTEPLWSVLETRVRNRLPPPPSLKQLEYALQEEWHKIPLKIFHSKKDCGSIRQKVVQHHINKEISTVPVVFPFF